MNVIAVESVMNLARKMKKLEVKHFSANQLKLLLPSPQALVHVSTAYVNTELSQVTQKFLGIKM